MSERWAEDVTAIRHYENLASIEERRRLVRRGEDGNISCALSGDALSHAAELRRDWLSFADKVDLILEEDDPVTRPDYAHDLILVRSTTPEALTRLGLDDLPVTITEGHLWTIMQDTDPGAGRHAHRLQRDVLLALPELLEHPFIISDNPKAANRLLLVLTALSGGKPLIVPIEPNYEGEFLELDFSLSNLITDNNLFLLSR